VVDASAPNQLLALAEELGITLNVVEVSGAEMADALRSGRVDAVVGSLAQTYPAVRAGVPLRDLDFGSAKGFPGNGLTATPETLAANPDQAAALARGYAMGSVFALNNPEAAIRIAWEEFPETGPANQPEAEALRDEAALLSLLTAAVEPPVDVRWGEGVAANYQALADFGLRGGTLTSAPDLDQIFTNDLIEEANDFDVEQVAAEASDYAGG
jgi:NitT/TauT family transport system substrate-binding protein